MRRGYRLKRAGPARRSGPTGLNATAFEGLLHNSGDHVLVLGPDYTVLAAGDAFRAAVGPGVDPVGLSFLELLDTGSRAKAQAFLSRMNDRPGVVELNYRAGPTAVRLASYSVCRYEAPDAPCFVAIGRDQEDPLKLVEQLMRLNSQAEQAVREQAQRAMTDPLTGLGNRRWLFERLTALWATAARQDRPAWVMVADLDHFKRVNDTRGHRAGDDALRAAAGAFKRAVRADDLVARYGGEEFVLAGTCRDRAELAAIAARVLGEVRGASVETPGGPLSVTTSLGAVLARPHAGCTPADALRVADEAVYRAKKAGRDRCEVVPEVLGAKPVAGTA